MARRAGKEKHRVNCTSESGVVPCGFMKFGVVTRLRWDGPPRHEHPREEPFSLVISGQMHVVQDELDRVAGPGAMIRIPRMTGHRLRPEVQEIETLYPGKA